MAKSEKIRINLNVPAEMLAEIDTSADNVGISRTAYILQGIRQVLDTKKATESMSGMQEFIAKKFEDAFNEVKLESKEIK